MNSKGLKLPLSALGSRPGCSDCGPKEGMGPLAPPPFSRHNTPQRLVGTPHTAGNSPFWDGQGVLENGESAGLEVEGLMTAVEGI